MHHSGAIHADSKASAVACVRSVIREDWEAVRLLIEASECKVCLIECLAVLALMYAVEHVEPCEEHNELMFDPDDLEEVDAELVGILGALAAGDGDVP